MKSKIFPAKSTPSKKPSHQQTNMSQLGQITVIELGLTFSTSLPSFLAAPTDSPELLLIALHQPTWTKTAS